MILMHQLMLYFIILGIVNDWKNLRDSGASFPGDDTNLHPGCKPIVLLRQVIVDQYLGHISNDKNLAFGKLHGLLPLVK